MFLQLELRWTALMLLCAALLAPGQSRSQKTEQPADPSQYVGTETCKSCHEDKSAHARPQEKRPGQQWQGCEACHGPGKRHAEAGDPENIIRFETLSRHEAVQICSRCHAPVKGHSALLHSQHAKTTISCLDCHSQHSAAAPHLLKTVASRLCTSCHLAPKLNSPAPSESK
ncbi:MAG TPA: cytochrome c3 family protein [Verrucomicrobiae bacterium]|nr:cytochrome c3 family protein [Verrucomicrobiae bacterium]